MPTVSYLSSEALLIEFGDGKPLTDAVLAKLPSFFRSIGDVDEIDGAEFSRFQRGVLEAARPPTRLTIRSRRA